MHPSSSYKYLYFSHFTQSLHFMPSEGEILSSMTVCSCHVTYAFQSQSSLAKWLSVHLRTKWFSVQAQLQSLNFLPCLNCFYLRNGRHGSGFDESRSYFSGKLKRRRETDMQREIEAKQ